MALKPVVRPVKALPALDHARCPLIREKLVWCYCDFTSLQFLQVHRRVLAFFSMAYPGLPEDMGGAVPLPKTGMGWRQAEHA
jgi:hypothetical protein